MQGPQIVPQPAENDQGVLLYNGDIFDETWDSNISDTQLILQKLICDFVSSLCAINIVYKLNCAVSCFAYILLPSPLHLPCFTILYNNLCTIYYVHNKANMSCKPTKSLLQCFIFLCLETNSK